MHMLDTTLIVLFMNFKKSPMKHIDFCISSSTVDVDLYVIVSIASMDMPFTAPQM